ncbi:uncharacterized protein G2W53_043231 [Senna tora]|uniref:Uncharacterized protein n=1 Tax=Senna tora TaxID=362788 RepID=A0A834SKJ0_9FABA|nr:uncharacterized protein G2W53_043231 [Senna tora]
MVEDEASSVFYVVRIEAGRWRLESKHMRKSWI